jgi:ATP-binding cassette subfamily G (WHITE) protein 1
MVHLIFSDLTYTVDESSGKFRLPCSKKDPKAKDVLRGVSGEALPGEVLAVMGPSGAGKTSLFDALTGTLPEGSFSGTVLMDGSPPTAELKKRITYVKQNEVIQPLFSLRESFLFTAALHLSHLTEEQRVAYVDKLIDVFGLEKCKDTPVGSVKNSAYGMNVRGISGGERKRAYIIDEILTGPLMIFLDEPTSGLDSAAASEVYSYLRQLAKYTKCTIVMILHQPSSEMYHLFDKLLLMVEGRVVYSGPSGRQVMDCFAEAGMAVPDYFNPPEFFLKKISDKKDNYANARNLAGAYLRNRKGKNLDTIEKGRYTEADRTTVESIISLQVDEEEEGGKGKSTEEKPPIKDLPARIQSAPYLTQFKILFRRQFLLSWRSFNPLAMILTVFFALLIGLCSLSAQSGGRHEHIDDAKIWILNAVNFLSLVYAVQFMPSINELGAFSEEKPILQREYRAGAYSLVTYFLAKRTAAVLVDLIQPVTYWIIVYLLAGFVLNQWMLVSLALIVICTNIATVLGLCYAALSKTQQDAMGLQAMVSVGGLMTMGYYIAIGRLPVFLRWIAHINHWRYAYQGLLRSAYAGLSIKHVENSGFLNAENLARLGNATHYGNEILFDQLQVTLPFKTIFGVLFGFMAVEHIIAFLLILFLVVGK